MTMLCAFFAIFLAVLTCQESGISAKLTLLESEPYRISNYSDRMARNLTCTSDDDLSALVWNEDLKYYNKSKSRAAFTDSSTERSRIEFQNPTWYDAYGGPFLMGHLMNSRWEDLDDRLCLENGDCTVIDEILEKSWRIYVRGTDLKIIGCPPDDIFMASCLVIDLGKGTAEQTEPVRGARIECRNAQVPQKSSLSPVEWRALTLKFDRMRRRVTVYDEVEEIISCRTDESLKFFMLRGSNETLLRFDGDGHMATNWVGDYVASPWIEVLGSNICIEMLIMLCAGCKASIEMMSEEQRITIGEVLSKPSFNGLGSPPWQHVRFNKSIQDGFGSRVRFNVVRHLSKDNPHQMWASKYDPHRMWAVSSVGLCKDGDPSIYTTEAADQLTSSPFDVVLGSNICIEMLIGLCAGCKASIQLIGEQQSITMGEVMSQSSSYGDGSRPWQHVRFNTSVQDGFGSSVRIRVFTHLSKFDPHPLLVVSGTRLCKDDDTVRTSTIESRQVWNEERKEYVWPEVACQKLSNSNASLIRSTLSTQGEGKHGLTDNKEPINLNLVWLIAIPIVAALALLVYRKRNIILAKSNDKTTSVTQDRANSITRTSFHASPEDKTLMDQTHGMSPNMDTVQK